MSCSTEAPTLPSERIKTLDIIRGLALFGVFWMNLVPIGDFVPPDVGGRVPTSALDPLVTMIGGWLASGKAVTLFSISFGFGFAMIMDRAEKRGLDGRWIYFRRLAILFLIGVTNWLLLWFGDILHLYATIGLSMLLVRRWPNWLLLTVGLLILAFTQSLVIWWAQLTYGSLEAAPWNLMREAAAARRWEVFQAADYSLYVRENFHILWNQLYTNAIGLLVCAWTFARFLLGIWIYRMGWLQRAADYRQQLLFWSAFLLPIGLICAGIRPMMIFFELRSIPEYKALIRFLGGLGWIFLPLGYAALLVSICQNEVVCRRLSGFGAAGRMALTNYLSQSIIYNLVFYGLGLGLIRYATPTVNLIAAILIFAGQIAFSRWWLARYRFGPAEWLWRSGTYWQWQPMQLRSVVPTTA